MIARRFFSGTRAGATALVAAAVAVLTVGGTAIIGDHIWLVDQRDVVKNASDAAGLAATLAMNRRLLEDPTLSDADLETELDPIAERYVKLNLRHLTGDALARAESTLVVKVTVVDRAEGIVNVQTVADLGGMLVSRHVALAGNYVGEQLTEVESTAIKVIGAVEVALALDVSQSMGSRLDGTGCCWANYADRRISIVKRAASMLVEILGPNPDAQVAIGVVPWSRNVRLDAAAMAKWESNGWARYPTQRVYGVPYECKPSLSCVPPSAVEHQVPASPPENWKGCLDDHRMGAVSTRASVSSASDFLTLPSHNSFAQGFYMPLYGKAYECLVPAPADFSRQLCHSRNDLPWRRYIYLDPQYGCFDEIPPILPLTTDGTRVKETIDALLPSGDRTYSALGVLWGQRLLQHSWNSVWGSGVHPVDPDSREFVDVRKAIVLLTDGEDTHCGTGNVTCERSAIGVSRTDACDAAKAEGTEIFVVAAMDPNEVSQGLGDSLRACSSATDNPDGSYAFLNNSTPEDLEAAFAEIARQLMSARRLS